MLIRISDLITLPELSKAEYTGNSDYISNIAEMIININNWEVPEFIDYGDLLFVTFSPQNLRAELIKNFFNSISPKGCSVVIIYGYDVKSKFNDLISNIIKDKNFGVLYIESKFPAKSIIRKISGLLYRNSNKKDFISGLVSSLLFNTEIYNTLDYVYMAKLLNYNVYNEYRVFILKITDHNETPSLYDEIQNQLNSRFGIELTVFHNGYIIAVSPSFINNETVFNVIKEYYTEELLGKLNITCKIAFGESYEGLENVKESLGEALRTFDMIGLLGGNIHITSYKKLGLFRILYEMNDSKVFKSFYEDMFSPLWKYDNEKQTALFKTLEVYISCNCDIDETASELFIHKNTLRYRLTRIEEILDIDIHNIDHITEVSAAFKIRRLSSILDE